MTTEVGVGILGIGFMGRAHYSAYQQVTGARVTAIATRDRNKWTGDWRGIGGNYGAAGSQVDLTGVATYDGLDGLLSDPSVTLVDICLPTAQHRDAAIAAMEAGRDVLVEKPIALTSEEANEMLAVAKATGRRLLVAHVLQFMPAYERLRSELTKPETEILGLTMVRQVSTPWREPRWRARLEATGGPVIDLLIHDVDLIQSALGTPKKVMALGSRQWGYVVNYHVMLDYGSDVGPVTLMGGICGVPGAPLQQKYELLTSQQLVEFNPAQHGPITLASKCADGDHLEELADNDPITGELQFAVDTVRGDADGQLLSGSRATSSLSVCLAVNAGVALGSAVALEPQFA